MSRHNVSTNDPDKYECVVGYDAPLDTYFGQVIDLETDNDTERMVLWVGTSVHEITGVERLSELVAPYATLPPR